MGNNSVEEYFLWFMIYSIMGWIYETILCSVEARRFINRGFLNGPYCPIYGSGAVLLIFCLGKITNPFLIFFLGVLITCTLEYLTSFFMEKLFHARWWDYSERKFNINGRVCLLGAVVFGSFSVILLKLIHPVICHYTKLIPPLALHIITISALVIFVADNIVTITGFSGFNKKLKELNTALEQLKSTVSNKIHLPANSDSPTHIYQRFSKKFNIQQRRMIHAFPKLKPLKYSKDFSELRNVLAKRKKDKTRK
ncbi:MAG: putative ABC transporter permease [Ruminococcus sp.]